ncbi:MAG TPA: hypothetical protein VHD90_03010 [Phototrophicaceae bacterium]|nr:hypothetical protein [Phototrophicaceae bacterium]
MQQQVGVNIQQYLDALEELEKEHMPCSTSLILHPSGSGAVKLEFFFTRMGSVAVDFDTEDGDDIMDAIHRLAEKARQAE